MRSRAMGRIPNQVEGSLLVRGEREFAAVSEVVAQQSNGRPQFDGLRSCHRTQTVIGAAYPRDLTAIAEAQDEFCAHGHAARGASDQTDQVDTIFALGNGHEVDQRGGAVSGLESS